MANFNVDGNVFYLSGDLSIASSESLFNFFREITLDKTEIIIDLKAIESWDTSTIQIFIALSKKMKKNNISIIWKNVPKEMLSDIKLMGLSNLFEGETYE
jgi:anti-anti-sigma factor